MNLLRYIAANTCTVRYKHVEWHGRCELKGLLVSALLQLSCGTQPQALERPLLHACQ